MIAIIDYGMGNLRSVQKAFEKVGATAQISHNKQDIEKAEKLVLPGVGAMKPAIEKLASLGLIEPIRKFINSGKPFLGICLGFQLLFAESEEFGLQKGLDLFSGRVVGFPPGNGLKVPHMGWNRIDKKKESRFLDGLSSGDYVYFVHSFYVVPEDSALVATTTEYGGSFVSSIATENLFACQFHPEKSQELGLRILRNFGEFVAAR